MLALIATLVTTTPTVAPEVARFVRPEGETDRSDYRVTARLGARSYELHAKALQTGEPMIHLVAAGVKAPLPGLRFMTFPLPEEGRLLATGAGPILELPEQSGYHGHAARALLYYDLSGPKPRMIGVLDTVVDRHDTEPGCFDGKVIERAVRYGRGSSGTLVVHAEMTLTWQGAKGQYDERYALSRESIRLVERTPTKSSFIGEATAKEIIDTMFDVYYGWRPPDGESRAPNSPRRAEYFTEVFEYVALLRPQFAPAHYNLACMRALTGHPREALPSLRRAFELDGTTAARRPETAISPRSGSSPSIER